MTMSFAGFPEPAKKIVEEYIQQSIRNRGNRQVVTFEHQVVEWEKRHALGPELLAEQLLRFSSNIWLHYWKAVEQQKIGATKNYRNFGVGASAQAWSPLLHITDDQAKCFVGYNSKETPQTPKHCAEKRLFEMASAAGYRLISGLVVVGPYQPDDISGHECTTLHPCAECRSMLAKHPLAWPEMPILTALPPGPKVDLKDERFFDKWVPVHEWHTLSQVLNIHGAAR